MIGMKNQSLRAAAVAAALAVSGSALAASDNPFSNATDGQQGGLSQSAVSPRPVLKDDLLVNMSREDCERAIRKAGAVSADYQSGVDAHGRPVASADYQPGVDAHGKPVTPAEDPNASALAKSLVPEVIDFPLDVDIFDFSNRADLQSLFGNVTSSIGKVSYDLGSGQMTINGIPLNDPEAEAVAAACMAALGR